MSGDVDSTGRLEDGQEFWIAEVRGTKVTIHFGKLGTTGHKATRELGSIKAAEEFLADRLRKKLEAGFKPV